MGFHVALSSQERGKKSRMGAFTCVIFTPVVSGLNCSSRGHGGG